MGAPTLYSVTHSAVYEVPAPRGVSPQIKSPPSGDHVLSTPPPLPHCLRGAQAPGPGRPSGSVSPGWSEAAPSTRPAGQVSPRRAGALAAL